MDNSGIIRNEGRGFKMGKEGTAFKEQKPEEAETKLGAIVLTGVLGILHLPQETLARMARVLQIDGSGAGYSRSVLVGERELLAHENARRVNYGRPDGTNALSDVTAQLLEYIKGLPSK